MRTRARLSPSTLVVLVAAVTAVTGLTRPRAAHTNGVPSSPGADSELAGAYWSALPERAKDAYVRGFLAGAAAEQARLRDDVQRSPVPDDTDGLIRRIDDLHVAHALRFPFASSLYASQLDDYYWWEERRSVPLVSALVIINGQLLSRGR